MAQSKSQKAEIPTASEAPGVGGHTPTPWRAVRNDHYWEIHGGGHGQIGDVCASKFIHVDGNKLPSDEAEAIADANAAFIVRACNSHDALVKTLARAEEAVAELCNEQNPANECWNVLSDIRATLLSARGVQ